MVILLRLSIPILSFSQPAGRAPLALRARRCSSGGAVGGRRVGGRGGEVICQKSSGRGCEEMLRLPHSLTVSITQKEEEEQPCQWGSLPHRPPPQRALLLCTLHYDTSVQRCCPKVRNNCTALSLRAFAAAANALRCAALHGSQPVFSSPPETLQTPLAQSVCPPFSSLLSSCLSLSSLCLFLRRWLALPRAEQALQLVICADTALT